jgi:hypothetical protein
MQFYDGTAFGGIANLKAKILNVWAELAQEQGNYAAADANVSAAAR